MKPPFLSQKRAIRTFLSRKFTILRSSIAFEDFLGSSIATQVMPPLVDDGDDDLSYHYLPNVKQI